VAQVSSLCRLAIGTVQLGTPYGIANTSGMPTEHQAVALVRDAIAAGITTIDTARAYGDAERRIGLALSGLAPEAVTVVTKLDPLGDIGTDDRATALQAAAKSIERSRTALRRDHLDVLLLHRAAHRTQWDGAVWQSLLRKRDAGHIGRIGVSVGNPHEALAALADPNVDHIQLPFNLLDWRWKRAGVSSALGQRPSITVHARSVFLQGLLAGEVTRWPVLAVSEATRLVEHLRAIAHALGRESLADLALAYARAQNWIGAMVIGVETQAQLTADLALFQTPMLTQSECHLIETQISGVDAALLDPSQWKRNAASADQIR
jgi:aryl-alcohol dehydrogenase-like predicted oxidoreductase